MYGEGRLGSVRWFTFVLASVMLFSCGADKIDVSIPNAGTTTSTSTTLPHLATLKVLLGVGDPGAVNAMATASNALLGSVGGLSNDTNNLNIVDTFGSIRKFNFATQTVTTLAGVDGANIKLSGGVEDSTDGTGATARFTSPGGITYAGGYLYLAGGFASTIRKIDPNTGKQARSILATSMMVRIFQQPSKAQ